MKKITKILIVLSIVFFSSSCKKDVSSSQSDSHKNSSALTQISRFYQSNNSFDGSILIVNDYMKTKFNKVSYSFSFQGQFPSTTNYSTISFNNYSINFNSNKTFYSSSTIDTLNLQGNMNSFFGVNNLIEIDGNIFIHDFYIPAPVKVSFPNNSDFQFDKSEGISFNLEVDENNTTPIIIVLEYVDENIQEDQVYLTKSYQLNSQATSFTIPASDLSSFPVEESLVLYVGCGNSSLVSFDNNDYDLEGIDITYLPSIKLY